MVRLMVMVLMMTNNICCYSSLLTCPQTNCWQIIRKMTDSLHQAMILGRETSLARLDTYKS